MLLFRNHVKKKQRELACEEPLIVHCSAGVGRSGTFIAIDRLMQRLEVITKHESKWLQYWLYATTIHLCHLHSVPGCYSHNWGNQWDDWFLPHCKRNAGMPELNGPNTWTVCIFVQGCQLPVIALSTGSSTCFETHDVPFCQNFICFRSYLFSCLPTPSQLHDIFPTTILMKHLFFNGIKIYTGFLGQCTGYFRKVDTSVCGTRRGVYSCLWFLRISFVWEWRLNIIPLIQFIHLKLNCNVCLFVSLLVAQNEINWGRHVLGVIDACSFVVSSKQYFN